MKPIASNVFVGSRGLSIYDLRQAAKADPAAFFHKVQKLSDEKKLRLSMLQDIRSLYQGLADISVPVVMNDAMGARRSLMASAFPILTGTLMIAAINEAYQNVPTIGQELVSEIEDDKKVTSMVSIQSLDKNIEEVKDGDDFPLIGATEEKVEIRHKQNGRRLSIHANMIRENEIADIVQRVNALGEIAAEWVEEQTLKRVTDHDGSAASAAEPYVYRPDGTGTALYSATANTPGTRAPSGTRINNNAFADYTDIEAVRARLRTMKNNMGKRINIPWSETKFLVPDTIIDTVLRTINSEYVPGVVNEKATFGPGGKFAIPAERVVSSPKLDDLSTSAWYAGAFQRQFKRKWKLRFEYVTLGQDTQAYLQSMIAFQARIAWDVEIGATDYVYVVQSISATTAPKDE